MSLACGRLSELREEYGRELCGNMRLLASSKDRLRKNCLRMDDGSSQRIPQTTGRAVDYIPRHYVTLRPHAEHVSLIVAASPVWTSTGQSRCAGERVRIASKY